MNKSRRCSVPPTVLAALAASLAACGGADAGGPDPLTSLPSPTEASASPEAPAPPPSTWAHAYVGDVQIDGITSDANGAIYAAGYFVGHAEFDATRALDSVPDAAGKPTKDIFVAKHARPTGDIAWVRHLGGPGAEGNVYDLVAGTDGTVVASGAFSGTVDFDGTVLTSTVAAGSGTSSSGTYGNMFVAGLDPATGSVRWVQQGTGNLVSGGNEVASEPSGGFVQVGIYGGREAAGGAMTIGKTTLAFGGGRYDTYAAKLGRSGEVLWATPIGGSGAQRGKAIATDAQGNVLVAGDAWSGETRFAAGQAFTSDDQDFWVAKYTPEGALLWFHAYASSGVDEVKGIGADQAGNIVVAASFAGPSMDVGGKVVTARPGARNTGIVFALSPDGSRALWTQTITSVGKCCELEVDARGHVFLGNAALGPSIQYGSGDAFPLGSPTRAALLTELGPDGAHVASWTAEATTSEFGELTLLADGGTAVAGSFDGSTFRFGDISLTGKGPRTQFVLAIAR